MPDLILTTLWAACFPESVIMGPLEDSQDGLAARFAKLGVTNSSVRTDGYPPIQPNCTGFLQVSDTHTLYWEESGNPEGQVRTS